MTYVVTCIFPVMLILELSHNNAKYVGIARYSCWYTSSYRVSQRDVTRTSPNSLRVRIFELMKSRRIRPLSLFLLNATVCEWRSLGSGGHSITAASCNFVPFTQLFR